MTQKAKPRSKRHAKTDRQRRDGTIMDNVYNDKQYNEGRQPEG